MPSHITTARFDTSCIKQNPYSPVSTSPSPAPDIRIRGMANAAKALGLSPIAASPSTLTKAFTVPINSEGSDSAIILAGPPLIDKTPEPFQELLKPNEFSSVPMMRQKLSLLRAKLGQEELNLAALRAQGAFGKLIRGVEDATVVLKRLIRQNETRLQRKLAFRDKRIAEIQSRTYGRRLLKPQPSSRSVKFESTPDAAKSAGHWFDINNRRFVPMNKSRVYPDIYRPVYTDNHGSPCDQKNEVPQHRETWWERREPQFDLIWDMHPRPPFDKDAYRTPRNKYVISPMSSDGRYYNDENIHPSQADRTPGFPPNQQRQIYELPE